LVSPLFLGVFSYIHYIVTKRIKKVIVTKKKSTPKKVATKKFRTPNKKKIVKATRSAREYIRVSEKSKKSKFNEMGERVQRGEVRWSYYAIDGNIGYHHYLIIK
jgi:hypothetical protein